MSEPKPNPDHSLIYERLASLGIAQLEIEYDGVDDNGCVYHVAATSTGGVAVLKALDETVTLDRTGPLWDAEKQMWVLTPRSQPMPLREALIEWSYDLLEAHYTGWQDNDGSCGTITVDVAARKLTIAHNIRVTQLLTETLEIS